MPNPTTTPIMTPASGPGNPTANPFYLVDVFGNPLGSPIAAQGAVMPFGSNAAALTASTDYQFKWGAAGTQQINHVMIQNNSSVNVNFDLDAVANAGSILLLAGQTIFLDVQTLVLHLFSTGTPNVNGTAAGNIVVRGWL